MLHDMKSCARCKIVHDGAQTPRRGDGEFTFRVMHYVDAFSPKNGPFLPQIVDMSPSNGVISPSRLKSGYFSGKII